MNLVTYFASNLTKIRYDESTDICYVALPLLLEMTDGAHDVIMEGLWGFPGSLLGVHLRKRDVCLEGVSMDMFISTDIVASVLAYYAFHAPRKCRTAKAQRYMSMAAAEGLVTTIKACADASAAAHAVNVQQRLIVLLKSSGMALSRMGIAI